MKNIPKEFRRFFVLISIFAFVTLALAMFQMNWNSESLIDLLVFGILAVASESLPVAMPIGGYVTVGFAVFFSSMASVEPGVSLLVAASGGLLVISSKVLNAPLWKRIFNASQFIVSMAVALGVLRLLGISAFYLNIQTIVYYLLAAVFYVLTNVTIVSIALGKLNKKSPFSIWSVNIRSLIPSFLALAPLGLLMAMLYKNYGSLGLILLFVPLLLARHSFQLYMDMRKNYLNTVEALVQALEAKDSYTSGHSSRVAQWSVKLAEALKLPEDRVEYIKYAGVLHDIGKIGVSENILNKKDKLEDSEWEMIRNHPVIGQNIIQGIDFLFDVGSVVRYHHERYDGMGYPERIAGEAIPLESRIIAVADTYDAMTSDRSYRKGLSSIEAIVELRRVAGTQLDPQIVEVFCRIVQEENPQLQILPQVQVV